MKTGLKLALTGILVVSSAAGAQEVQRPPNIWVNASSEVRVPPDRATIHIGVQSRAATAAEASSQNALKQRAVIAAIRGKGVPADQIGTIGFNVIPETRYDREGQAAPRTTSYLVSNVVVVELRRIDQVGPVIDASLGAGANQINALNFGVSQADSARRVALAAAVAKARADADVMARAAGGSLGSLMEIQAMEVYMPQPRPMMLEARAAAAADATPIEPGQETIRASVSARWHFVSGGGR